MRTTWHDLLRLPLAELQEMAREKRDRAHGSVVTYSPKVFIPVTRLCRDRCGYCTYAVGPRNLRSPYLSREEVLRIAAAGAEAGCHEALFTLGERPELRYPQAAEWLVDHGYESTVDYVAAPMYLRRRARRGPTWREVVLVHAVARIVYHGLIDNVQASWVKLGVPALRQLLRAGVNDLGGTLMDENISRAAGAAHGQMMSDADFDAVLAPLGRSLVQRTTLYDRVVPVVA